VRALADLGTRARPSSPRLEPDLVHAPEAVARGDHPAGLDPVQRHPTLRQVPARTVVGSERPSDVVGAPSPLVSSPAVPDVVPTVVLCVGRFGTDPGAPHEHSAPLALHLSSALHDVPYRYA